MHSNKLLGAKEKDNMGWTIAHHAAAKWITEDAKIDALCRNIGNKGEGQTWTQYVGNGIRTYAGLAFESPRLKCNTSHETQSFSKSFSNSKIKQESLI